MCNYRKLNQGATMNFLRHPSFASFLFTQVWVPVNVYSTCAYVLGAPSGVPISTSYTVAVQRVP